MIRNAFVVASIFAVIACQSGDTVEGTKPPAAEDPESGTSGDSRAARGQSCNDAHDGESACGSNECAGGTYCRGASICENGCQNESNCKRGQYCDKSTATFDIGTCRPCSPSGGSTCASRCAAKAATCSAPNASALCNALCAQAPTASQMDCLEATSCTTLARGGEICELSIEKSGGGT